MTGAEHPTPEPAATLRARLGRAAVGSARHIQAAAELAEGEQVAAIVVAAWRRRGWVALATDAGLRLARRPRLLGRRRACSFGWDELTAVGSGPGRLSLTFGEVRVDLMGAAPHDEYVRLMETARARLGGEQGAVDELRAMANRKLGRLLAFGFEAEIESLPDRLAPGEWVQRMAAASLGFDGLLVLTDRRLLLVASALRRANERAWEVAREDIRRVEPVDEGLWLGLTGGATMLRAFMPPERRDEFAAALAVPPDSHPVA